MPHHPPLHLAYYSSSDTLPFMLKANWMDLNFSINCKRIYDLHIRCLTFHSEKLCIKAKKVQKIYLEELVFHIAKETVSWESMRVFSMVLILQNDTTGSLTSSLADLNQCRTVTTFPPHWPSTQVHLKAGCLAPCSTLFRPRTVWLSTAPTLSIISLMRPLWLAESQEVMTQCTGER